MYPIKTIAALTGLSTETLRAWERRYRTVVPERDESGRRMYSQEDLERLLLLSQLTREGHAIGKLSQLDNEGLQQLSRQVEKADDHRQHYFDQIIGALREYRADRFEELLKRALLVYEPVDYVRDILEPALQRVGQLWHDNQLSVAQEHLFSACVKRIVLGMINNVHQLSPQRPSMLFATPQGEVHEFGILMACMLAASQQYNCYYLGSDLPAREIVEASSHLNPDIIVLGIVNSPPEWSIIKQLLYMNSVEDIGSRMIWAGGMGAAYLANRNQLPGRFRLIVDTEAFFRAAGQFKFNREHV